MFFGVRPAARGEVSTADIPYMHMRPTRVALYDPAAAPFAFALAKRLTRRFFRLWSRADNRVLIDFPGGSRAKAGGG